MTLAPPTLTIQETHALLQALQGTGGSSKKYRRQLRNYTMALVMLEAGLRVGELVQLRHGHLFFNCLPVTSIIISPEISKSNKERQIPVSTRLSDALSTYHLKIDPLDDILDDCFAFWTRSPVHPLTTRQVERIISAAALRSIGRPVHPHVLRHTFASKLMRVTNAAIVQQLLGHKHLSSTQVYCHPNGEDLKNAIDSASDPPNNLASGTPVSH